MLHLGLRVVFIFSFVQCFKTQKCKKKTSRKLGMIPSSGKMWTGTSSDGPV